MPEQDVQLFFVPASGPEARAHLLQSISAPIATDLSRFLSSEQLNRARASDGHYYAWAAKMGPNNSKTWQAMRRGDFCAFYTQGTYSFVASVTSTEHNAELGKAIWGESSDGVFFEFIYFLDKPVRVDIPLEHLSDHLQSGRYQGFIQLSDARKETILSSYDSVADFVMDRFLSLRSVPANYAILRTNDASDWNDSENSYHYGRIANYTKLKTGSAVILDRKTTRGAEIIGRARITDIISLDDGTFEAKLDRKALEARPYEENELLQLRMQPGYNVQHSIRPISSELYKLILGEVSLPAGPSLDHRLRAIAEIMSWPLERVKSAHKILEQSKAILLAGPPGTGKTYLAQTLRANLSDSESDSEIVVFHPNYSYEDFIQGIRPRLEGSQLGYELQNGTFLRLAERAAMHPDRTFILVIDELNRGNVPKIFGEMLFSLEYRDREHAIALASGSSFSVPSNLWIIATMNTADRSVMALDAALRRRFRQISLEPDYDVLRTSLEKKLLEPPQVTDACERLRELNEELMGILNDPGRLLGHFFLMVGDLSPASYSEIWESQIRPVLAEYLFEQPDELARLASIFLRL